MRRMLMAIVVLLTLVTLACGPQARAKSPPVEEAEPINTPIPTRTPNRHRRNLKSRWARLSQRSGRIRLPDHPATRLRICPATSVWRLRMQNPMSDPDPDDGRAQRRRHYLGRTL
jgi:curli biogenesis system outer membrane secretion channel CsgG